jgi:hypothetical protein
MAGTRIFTRNRKASRRQRDAVASLQELRRRGRGLRGALVEMTERQHGLDRKRNKREP